MIDFVNEVFVVENNSKFYFLFKQNTSVIDLYGVFIKLLDSDYYTVFKNKIIFKEDTYITVESLLDYYTIFEDSVNFKLTQTGSTFKYLAEQKTNIYEYAFKLIHVNLKEYSEHFFDVSILNTEKCYFIPIPNRKIINIRTENFNNFKDKTFIEFLKLHKVDFVNVMLDNDNKLEFVLTLSIANLEYNVLDTTKLLLNYNLENYSLPIWYPKKPFSNLTNKEFKRFIKLNFDLTSQRINIVQTEDNIDFFVTRRSIYGTK